MFPIFSSLITEHFPPIHTTLSVPLLHVHLIIRAFLCIAMSLSWNLLPRLSAWLAVSLYFCPNSDIIFRETLSDINAGCSSNFCFTLFSSFIVLSTILNHILCLIIVYLLPLSYKLHEGRDLLCLTITFPVLAWRLVYRPHSANMYEQNGWKDKDISLEMECERVILGNVWVLSWRKNRCN